MQRFDLARILFGDWRSSAEAHIANAVHLAAVLFALWVAREQGMTGPSFDFITLTAIATTVVFGIGRLARTPKPAGSTEG